MSPRPDQAASRRSVLIIEPESSGIGLCGAAERLGFEIDIFDRRPRSELAGRIAAAVTVGSARFTQVETRDTAAVLDAAVRLAAQQDLAAVIPGFEYAVEASAQVAAKLGLPGLDPTAAIVLGDKILMKQALAAGAPAVPIPEGDDGMRLPAQLAFPVVVKPVDGCGSLLVSRADTPEQLRDIIARSRHSPLADMGKVLGGRLLVEPYVDGPEFSIEGLVAEGRVLVSAVTEKRLGPEPYFVEVGHVVEAGPDPIRQELLVHAAVQAVQALGITVGAFHAEVRLSATGPVVIEVAARLGGDLIPDLVARVHGRDLYDATVRAFAGLSVPSIDPSLSTVPTAAVRFFTVRQPARLRDPVTLRLELARVPGCEHVEILAAPGAALQPATDFRQRFGYALVTAGHRGELESRLDNLDRIAARFADGVPCAS